MQFENELREEAEYLVRQNAAAEAAWKAAQSKVESENSIGNPQTRVRYIKTLRQDIVGGRAVLENWATDDSGIWRWSNLNTTRVDTVNDGYRYFTLGSYRYSYIDSYRTCVMNYEETLFKRTVLGWIPGDSTQYVEWYAAS